MNAYLKQKSYVKAAKEVGCSTKTIRNAVKEAGIDSNGEWKNGTSSKKSKTGSLAEAMESGDKRKMLIAIRSKLAISIDNCESDRDLPALTKRFMEVDEELSRIPDPDKIRLSKHDRLKEYAKRQPGTDA